jgi:5'-methylthioadenosine phosphorylase
VTARAAVGIFGGSGFYSFLDDAETVELETPFGAPSAPVTIGEIDGTRVAFLPRHGRDHQFPPHAVPAKANLWAMRMLGVHSMVGPCAAGSLNAAIAPGDFVVLDQLVDRTHGRPDTFYDRGEPHHVAFADPYCGAIAPIVVDVARELGVTVHPTGTVVVIQGPRFSTRAESRWYRAQQWDVVNMTQYPEAYLARELGIHYTGIALVTDYDTGVEDDPSVVPVTQEQVFAFFEENVHRIRDLLMALVPRLPAAPAGCECTAAVGPLGDTPASPR